MAAFQPLPPVSTWQEKGNQTKNCAAQESYVITKTREIIWHKNLKYHKLDILLISFLAKKKTLYFNM
jgi:hypothetical protein